MIRRQNPFKKEFFRHIGLVSQLGFSVVFIIAVTVIFFSYIEKKLQTNGILMIAGVLLGVVLGMLTAYRQIKKYLSK
jgi:ABC-type dipeptide/oligopeptide/nickel transport system permease component